MQILAKTDQPVNLESYHVTITGERVLHLKTLFKWNGGGAWPWFQLFVGATFIIIIIIIKQNCTHAQLYNDSLALLLLLYFNINYHTLSFIPFNFLEVKVCNIFKLP